MHCGPARIKGRGMRPYSLLALAFDATPCCGPAARATLRALNAVDAPAPSLSTHRRA
jgi:hypothetical protein